MNFPSVLWHCWLDGRKGIQSVKKLSGGVLAWLSVWSKAQLMPLPLTVSCFSKFQIAFLPFWYRLTWVVLDKGPLNGCVCVVPINSTESISASVAKKMRFKRLFDAFNDCQVLKRHKRKPCPQTNEQVCKVMWQMVASQSHVYWKWPARCKANLWFAESMPTSATWWE